MSIFASYRSVLNFTATSFLILLLCVWGAGEVRAQYSNTAGVTPSLLTPGTPAGTYPLEGFDTVNLFNGNMNFSLPILTIKGRGNVSHTINLRIEQRWQVDGYSAAFGVYVPMAHWWTGIEPGYGPGTMEGRSVNDRVPSVGRRDFENLAHIGGKKSSQLEAGCGNGWPK